MKPLKHKTRFISFLGLLILFIIIAPILIIYSQGYRITNLDDAFSFIKTGGIFVHSENITNTEVYLDGEFVKNSGVLIRNTFIQDLRPLKEYKVEVYKEGYNGYVKNIFVNPTLVSEVTVLMLPLEIDKREIMEFFDTEGNATTTSPQKAALNSTLIFKTNAEYLELKNLFEPATSTKSKTTISKINQEVKDRINLNNSTTTATTTKEIPEYFEKLGVKDPDLLKNLITMNDEVSWLENGNVTINWIGKKENIPYYYCVDVESDCREKIGLDWIDEIKRFDFFPGRTDVWVVLTKNGIYAVEIDDRSERNIQPIYVGQNLDFRINSNSRIVVKDGKSFFELRF